MTPDALADLHAAAFQCERPWAAVEFKSLLDSPRTQLTVKGDGFALWRTAAGEAELLTIAVHPGAQGQGLGTTLMHHWMTEAAQTADTAFLEVASDNLGACALYAKCGFEIVGRRVDYYRRATTHADALVLRARLPFSVPKKSSGE